MEFEPPEEDDDSETTRPTPSDPEYPNQELEKSVRSSGEVEVSEILKEEPRLSFASAEDEKGSGSSSHVRG